MKKEEEEVICPDQNNRLARGHAKEQGRLGRFIQSITPLETESF
jgi:hypothetical protein